MRSFIKKAPKIIWIVGGGDEFGIKALICSFTNGYRAELFMVDCYEHNKKRPKAKSSLKTKRRWEKGHPAGENGIWSSYYIYSVPFFEEVKS